VSEFVTPLICVTLDDISDLANVAIDNRNQTNPGDGLGLVSAL
jgi:hypothetical protein